MGWVEWISANILKTTRVYWRAPVLLILIYLFLFTQLFYHDNEKAKEKIDTIRDSTTEQGSELSVPGPKFNCLR